MKKQIILFSLAIIMFATPFIGRAQGNLQFNRAINNNYSITVPGSSSAGSPSGTVTTTASITVPVGKVWKLEAANASTSASSAPTTYSVPTYGNSIGMIAVLDLGVIWSGPVTVTAPIWLGAGTHNLVLTGTAYNSSATWTHNLLLTGIEFNITQ